MNRKTPAAANGEGSENHQADDSGTLNRNREKRQRLGRTGWFLRADVERACMFALVHPARAHPEPLIDGNPEVAGRRPFPDEAAARAALAALGGANIRRAT